jgi:glutamate-1-semialdehyde aminotransferase
LKAMLLFVHICAAHNNPFVNGAVKQVLAEGAILFGTGTTELELKLAELLCSLRLGSNGADVSSVA